MRRVLFTYSIFYTFLSCSLWAQNDYNIYDSYHEKPEKFVQIVKYVNVPEDGNWKVYHPSTKILAYEFSIKESQLEGAWFSKNKSDIVIQSGEYVKGKKQGIWKTWYGNGQAHQETEYIDDDLYKLINYWKADGTQLVKNGDGAYFAIDEDGKRYRLIFNDGRLVGQVLSEKE